MEPLHVFLIAAGIILFIGLIALSAYFAAKRREELMKWASAHGLTFSRGKDRGFDDCYPEFKQLRHGSNPKNGS